ncbi:HAUS augmin-like complex subunit 3 [Ochotona princeps]|uniref:HAUS augmin-like complex subunit 3 n=1 Tax=Ochotona princeps TaxID=9978 RepID=UPI002715126C|nr:HAUS augmin-like complex subunit 3 [Ochotona princeps]
MSCGNEFVATLKTIGYPKADALHGEDFDWLFEAAEAAAFLRWFCGAVGEQNVLRADELAAWGGLRRSGQPLLDGAALAEALATRPPGPPERGQRGELRDELARLRGLGQLLRRRRALAGAAGGLRLGALEEAAARGLRQSRGQLHAAHSALRGQLQACAGRAAGLLRFLGQSHLLSRLPLEQYLSREEQSTAALTLYTREQFFDGVHEVVQSSNEENFQLLDMGGPAECGDPEGLQGRRLQLARLQLAYICAQHQLVHLRAGRSRLESSVSWAEEQLGRPSGKAVGKENLRATISSLKDEILKLEEQIIHIKDKSLPAVIKENAQLLNMPVVKGDFDLQIAKQDYYTARQELVLNQLIKQKASFELVQLLYEIELRKHWDMSRQLESLVQELRQSNLVLCQRLELFTDPAVSQQGNPRNTIDTRDCSSHRLYQLLESENRRIELFITRGNLEEMAERLKQEVSSLREELAVTAQEHSSLLSTLNRDVDMLCEALYRGGNRLLLSDQELVEQFHHVGSQLSQLNHLLTDVLADVKTKRKMLSSNKLHRMERELYVHFWKDEDYLKEIVENLENQCKAQAALQG